MLKAIRKHLKSKKSTSFMQYMKIGKKEDQLDNNWINFRHLDDLANDLFDNNLYNKDLINSFDLINSNNYNNYNQNYYNYNYNNERKEKKRIELQLREEKDIRIRDFEAIQLNHQHLHALHRFRRHKKRGISCEKDIVISFSPKSRVSIVNRRDFYYRFGKEEEEAMACFDFLNDIPNCDNIDANDSIDSDSFDVEQQLSSQSLVSVGSKDGSDSSWLGRNSQLSLSDSCVEYYSSSD